MDNKRCRFFRAKSPYHGAISGGDPIIGLNDDNLANCWCVKTQGPAAPDNGYVAPALCIEGRTCFVTSA
ncbi:hypothetical protein FNH22_08495 [Fulvivirga sp. M361]|uniref:hypothetical protein n=1 Tax=Fulvivirga sp. M361 TaxID=2594266 RepID=UPI00117B180D|nr:hypothetical protein [Fulvivirga sp. M361]TRX60079.1 hypothetical protein FNH22_08495 [Fulvivirga sp. M361]